jgi:hypothetical protein
MKRFTMDKIINISPSGLGSEAQSGDMSMITESSQQESQSGFHCLSLDIPYFKKMRIDLFSTEKAAKNDLPSCQ